MKRTLLIVVIILAVIIALPVINLIRWSAQAKKPMDIIIVDKTVPTLEREHHKSFNWILTNDRFVKKEQKTSYSYRKDYYGFYPLRPLRDKKWDKKNLSLNDLISLAEKNDAIYFTDTYGVFFNDWYRGISKSRRSRKIYGGLNNNDNLLIKEMKDRNKLIILEYNAFDYPTPPFESVRVQEKLGITYGGWTGKYFSSLDTTSEDFPIWMTSMYRKGYNKPWTFTKSGIVFLNEKAIIVLEEGRELKDAMPHIITDSINCNKYGVPKSVAFDQWFDIIDPMQNNIISRFSISTTTAGDTLLMANNLSNFFPAAIKETDPGNMYYFSGDFTHADIPYWTSRFVGIEKLKGILYSGDNKDDTRRFFWLYYRPLLRTIMTNYYDSVKGSE
jgi:hypothetical protein